MRKCFGALLSLSLAACGQRLDAADDGPGQPVRAASIDGVLATLAGTDGTITTLATYDDGTPHPGQNAVDIGAPGGSAVFHQVDYLPDSVGGGYLHVQLVREAGRCSQWAPGSPYYNGAKLYVTTYLWVDGGWLAQREAYQHVDPAGPEDLWRRWNNAVSGSPLWDDASLLLGDQRGGGLLVGTVHPVSRDIYNGPGGGLCTTGSHLHQEGEGYRAPRRFVGERVTGRYNDLHMFQP